MMKGGRLFVFVFLLVEGVKESSPKVWAKITRKYTM